MQGTCYGYRNLIDTPWLTMRVLVAVNRNKNPVPRTQSKAIHNQDITHWVILLTVAFVGLAQN